MAIGALLEKLSDDEEFAMPDRPSAKNYWVQAPRRVFESVRARPD